MACWSGVPPETLARAPSRTAARCRASMRGGRSPVMNRDLNSGRAIVAVGVVLVSLGASPAAAQESNPSTPELPRWADSFVVMTPGARYAKGGLGVAFAGRHYRDLWTTPIRVPVLDLRAVRRRADPGVGPHGQPDEIAPIHRGERAPIPVPRRWTRTRRRRSSRSSAAPPTPSRCRTASARRFPRRRSWPTGCWRPSACWSIRRPSPSCPTIPPSASSDPISRACSV